MADPHQKPLPAQGFSALMAGTLRGDPAQSWINFKSKKAGGWGGGGGEGGVKSLLGLCKASFWLW